MPRQLHRWRRVSSVWLKIVAPVLIASGGAVIGLSVSAYGASPSGPPHIMVIMMENESQNELIGNADAPSTNALAQQYGLATQSYALAHPSLPNYLELLSGSNFGVTSDDPPSSVNIPPSAQTLVNELESAGVSWRAYIEGMPSGGYTGSDAGGVDPYGGDYYLQHHNPFVYFPAVTSLPQFSADVVPLSTGFTTDLDSTNAPAFVWVTPNAVDDMHDGSPNAYGDADPSAGDAWLGNFVSQVQSTDWYAQGGNIIIEWDEGTESDTSGIGSSGVDGGGHIVTIDVSAALKANPQQDATPVSTGGVLHSIESAYGLPYLGDAGDAANGSIDSLLRSSPPSTTTTVPSTTATTATPTATPTASPIAPTSTKTTAPKTTATKSTKTTKTDSLNTPARAAPSTPKTDPPVTVDESTSKGTQNESRNPAVVSAAASSLAFTGSGPGMTTLTVVGGALVLLGFALLTLVGIPLRRVRRTAFVPSWVGPRGGGSANLPPAETQRNDLWLVPPSC